MQRARKRAMTAGESRPSTSVLAGGACPAAARVSNRARARHVPAGRRPRRVRRRRTNSAGGAGKGSPLALSSPKGRSPDRAENRSNRSVRQPVTTAGGGAKHAPRALSQVSSRPAKNAPRAASVRKAARPRISVKGASSSARRAQLRRRLAMRRRKRHPEAQRQKAPAVPAVAEGVAAGVVVARARSKASRRQRGVDSSPLTAAAPAVDRS